jgi:hypothetical protein
MEQDKTQLALQEAVELLSSFGLESSRPEDFRLDLLVPSAILLTVVKRIIHARWGYLSTITGLDHPGEEIREAPDRQWRPNRKRA